MTLKNKVLVCSDFRQNTRVLWNEATKEAICVDPGSKDAGVNEFLESLQLQLIAIVLTHSHVDHYGGVQTVLNKKQVPLYGHPIEQDFRKKFAERLAMWGIPPENYDACPEPTNYLSGGEVISLLGHEFQVILTPGHSPGSLSFYCPDEGFVLSGDVLFRESVGRTDLPGGSVEALKTSVATLLKLPGQTKVLSGHGPDTTVEYEATHNPFVRSMN